MKREEIIIMRDQAFAQIAGAWLSADILRPNECDARMATTMAKIVFDAACMQLAQLDGDAKVHRLIFLLDEAKSHLNETYGKETSDTVLIDHTFHAITEALDLLES